VPAVVGVPAEFPCKCVVDDAADDASTAADDASTVALSEIADAGVTDRVLDDFDETVKRWADIKNFLGKVPWADLADSEDDDWSFLDAAAAAASTIQPTGSQVEPTSQNTSNVAIAAKARPAVNSVLGNQSQHSIRHRSGQNSTPAESKFQVTRKESYSSHCTQRSSASSSEDVGRVAASSGVEEQPVSASSSVADAGSSSAEEKLLDSFVDSDMVSAQQENERLAKENAALLQLLQKQSVEKCFREAQLQAAGLHGLCAFGSMAATGYGSMWLPSQMMQRTALSPYANPWAASDGLVETSRQPVAHRQKWGEAMSVQACSSDSDSDSPELTKADAEIREGSEKAPTTVMLRNLPNNYTRAMLIDMLETEGFGDAYDFLYLPIDFQRQAALGYAFVNLLDSDIVQRFWSHFEGFTKWALPSKKKCFVSWCEADQQGLQANIERYRNSTVMHLSVPDECKPVLMKQGQRVVFPKPTKTIKAPRARNCRINQR